MEVFMTLSYKGIAHSSKHKTFTWDQIPVGPAAIEYFNAATVLKALEKVGLRGKQ